MKSFHSLITLTVVAGLLVSYNFIQAQWSAPTATAPNNNTPAPINVGSTTQAKSGNFMANTLAAATSTWSPRYCNASGSNCSFSIGGSGRDVSITSGSPTIFLNDNVVATSGYDSIGSRNFMLHVNGNRLFGLVDRNDNGIPYETADAAGGYWPMEMYAGDTPGADYVTFSNQVRAASYCDQSGGNCTSASGGGGGVGTGGQTWVNVTGSRAVSTNYQNTTGRPIMVNFTRGTVDGFSNVLVSTDGSTWVTAAVCWRGNSCSSVIVPNMHWYRIEPGPVLSWAELR